MQTTRSIIFGAVALLSCLLPRSSHASSHGEAPFVKGFPKIDNTDFYMFRSYEPGREDFVTILANYWPLQPEYGGPTYFMMDPEALYEIHVDNDGDNVEDLTFQFKFTNTLANEGDGLAVPVGPPGAEEMVAVPLRNIGPISSGDTSNLNGQESYRMWVVEGDRRTGNRTPITEDGSDNAEFIKPYDFIGTKTFGSPAGYEDYADDFIFEIDVPVDDADCSAPARVFVGQRAEAFFINLGRIFDLVNIVPIEGDSAPGAGDGAGFPMGITQDPANNVLDESNMITFALEVPIECLNGVDDASVIGAWATSSLPQARLFDPTPTFEDPARSGGAFVQISRLGHPLVNEVVIGLPMKDRFNASEPKDDAQFATFVTNPSLPALLNALFLDAVNDLAGLSLTNLAPTNFPRNDLVAVFLTGLAGVNQPASGAALSEMLRLNVTIPVTPRDQQQTLGVLAGDNAGFPNGRRPGDDIVDASLRVVMGAVCHAGLGLCEPEDAPVGDQPFTDGAPISAIDFGNAFPYLNTPFAE
ncbi:MAG: DUF4331 domain-containing protein [Myxococcota bacterium]